MCVVKKHISLLAIWLLTFSQENGASRSIPIPMSMMFGAATSAYQVEGAWNVSGKSESIWDRFTHTKPDRILDHSTGDITCDTYHKFKEDVQIMKDLGLQFYRFSLSWTRILPTGFPNVINKAGIDYYHEFINELLANNIQPFVTIYHWDLPQSLQDLGGFANPEIAVWLRNYADVVFEHFGDRVKKWVTINEPHQICEFGYGTGVHAPGIQSSGIGSYLCVRNLLKAHAEVYHLYVNKYKPEQKGIIGMAVECDWMEPLTKNSADIEASERARQFHIGIYANPIYHKDGDYPKIVKEFIGNRSKAEGFLRSRLPELTPGEVEFIKGTYDFFGMNHYTTYLVNEKENDPIGTPSTDKDSRFEMSQDPKWLTGSNPVFKLVPSGFRSSLKFIKENYGNPDIYITENGFPDSKDIEDTDRIKYITKQLEAVLDAVYEDNIPVKAYTVWSFMDNFEWAFGHMVRFGLYHVNFTDPNRTRTPKASAKFYKDIISKRKLELSTNA